MSIVRLSRPVKMTICGNRPFRNMIQERLSSVTSLGTCRDVRGCSERQVSMISIRSAMTVDDRPMIITDESSERPHGWTACTDVPLRGLTSVMGWVKVSTRLTCV